MDKKQGQIDKWRFKISVFLHHKHAIGEIKIKEIHFAWDDYKQGDSVLRGLEIYKKTRQAKTALASLYSLHAREL